MELVHLPLSGLLAEDVFCLSYPLQAGVWHAISKKMAALPMLYCDGENRLIAGHDFGHFLSGQGATRAAVIRMELSVSAALFFNYNFKAKLFGINLYEKLRFLQKAILQSTREEIYQNTTFDLPISGELLQELPRLTAPFFFPLLSQGKASLKAVLKLLALFPDDHSREPLVRLFETIGFTDGDQLRIIDMVSEIAFRDHISGSRIMEKIGLPELLETEMPQKNILQRLTRYRWPLVAAHEQDWLKRINSLDLPDFIQLQHVPFFEKDQVTLTARFESTAAALDWLGCNSPD
jgi:hypothetical protein